MVVLLRAATGMVAVVVAVAVAVAVVMRCVLLNERVAFDSISFDSAIDVFFCLKFSNGLFTDSNFLLVSH
jgi:hypothetical protein